MGEVGLSIVTGGLWSVTKVNERPYKNLWNFLTPKMIPNASLSMHSYNLTSTSTWHFASTGCIVDVLR